MQSPLKIVSSSDRREQSANRKSANPTSKVAGHPDRKTEDPLIALGRQMFQLEERRNAIDQSTADEDVTHCIYRQKEMSNIESQLDALRDYVSTMKACSIEGALIQLGRAHALISEADEMADGLTKSMVEKLDRLLFSISAILRIHTGPSMAGVEDWHVRHEHFDPFIPYEERIAMIDRD